jgi:hypothetical protein
MHIMNLKRLRWLKLKTLTRAAGMLLDNGAVITDYRTTDVQSLGHRDLPARRRDKTFGQPVYSSKQAFFLV